MFVQEDIGHVCSRGYRTCLFKWTQDICLTEHRTGFFKKQ